MATSPLVNLLHLRSVTQDQVPVNMEQGQIAFNLYDAVNPDPSGNYFVEVFIGTGGNDRRREDGTDRTADALISSLTTGEALISGKGWIQSSFGGAYTPVPGLNLDLAGVTTYKSALDTLDSLLGYLPTLNTNDKSSVVNAINELEVFVAQLTSGTQYVGSFNPTTDTIGAVSASGLREGYIAGTALPAPTDATERHYFIVTTEGQLSGAGNTPTGFARVGDWIISNGLTWELYNYTNDQAAVTQVAPVAPTTRPLGGPLQNGDLWYDSTNLGLFVWYDDGTSTQWVQAWQDRDPIVPSATAPVPTPGWPLWMQTTATDPLGNLGKLNFWDGTKWAQLVSDVADGGLF